jgi:hypothetical protein
MKMDKLTKQHLDKWLAANTRYSAKDRQIVKREMIEVYKMDRAYYGNNSWRLCWDAALSRISDRNHNIALYG